MIVLAVMAAGALGALGRFVVDGAIKGRRARTFPAATLIINISGSLVMGVIAGLVMYHAVPADVKTIVGTGFCGGYTTFSTASFETVRLAEQRRSLLAMTNAVGSMIGCAAACAVGLVLVWAL